MDIEILKPKPLESPKPPEAAPVIPKSKEVDSGKELLGKPRVALQGSLLRDALRPGTGVTLNEGDKLLKVKEKIDAGESFETPTINNGSMLERVNHWKNSEHKTFDAQKEAWLGSTNKFFDYYYPDETIGLSKEQKEKREGEKKVLEDMGMGKGKALDVYEEYFDLKGKGKGEIGYFAMKAARVLSYEQISVHGELLAKIGGFYGEGSAEVVRLLAEGARNLKENSDKFIPEAEAGFSKGLSAGEMEILDGVHARSGKWETDQKQKEDERKAAEEKQRQEKAAEAERLKKEQEANKKEGEKNKFGLDVGEKSIPKEVEEKDKEKYKNQDAVLSLNEKGVFGVFDGVGGNAAGDVASRLAVETVLNNLKELQDGLSEEEVEHHLKIALISLRVNSPQLAAKPVDCICEYLYS